MSPQKRREQTDRDRELIDEAKVFVQAFGNYVNHGGTAEGFIEAMNYEHRTLQQRMAGVMLQWFVYMASLPDTHYDARNAATVIAAKKMVKGLDIEMFNGRVHLPLI